MSDRRGFMKKKIIKILCVILILGGIFCLHMESRYSMDHVVKADLTEAEIISEQAQYIPVLVSEQLVCGKHQAREVSLSHQAEMSARAA